MTADVVIVGGGAIGWSCAFHILQASPTHRVVVLDKHPELASSLRGTGGFRTQFGSQFNIEMSKLAVVAFENFESLTGAELGFEQKGYLMFTSDPKKAEKIREIVRFQNLHGIPSEFLPDQEIKSQTRFIPNDNLIAGCFCKLDGYFNPPMVRAGFRDAALSRGAQELISGFENFADGTVLTQHGAIECEAIIVTTGHWTAGVGDKLGLHIPITPELHQLYRSTDSLGLPLDTPMMVDLDSSFHWRPRDRTIVMGFVDHELHDSDPDHSPEFDVSGISRLKMVGAKWIPNLGEDQPLTGWSGFYAPTPDGHPVLQRIGDVIIASGFGGHGIMHSPATGQIVTDLTLHGKTERIDLQPVRLERFSSGELNSELMIF